MGIFGHIPCGLRSRSVLPANELPISKLLSGASTKVLKGEDFFTVQTFTIGSEPVTFGLVADGHGGREAAAYCADHVLDKIALGAADGSTAALHLSAVEAFKALHTEVRNIPKCNAGSTLTVCALNLSRRELSVWNVGDSLGLLVHAGGYLQLGESHRLQNSTEEQQRCLALPGASLGRATNASGVAEGGLRAYPGGLAVTRCIGDADCGDVVSPLPAYSTFPLPVGGGAVVMATDGVWDNASNEDVSRILLDGRYDSAASAALKVVKRVLRTRGLTDDTTAVVILFSAEEAPHPTKARRPFSGSRRAHDGQSFLQRMSNDHPLMEQSLHGCIISNELQEGSPHGSKRADRYDNILASGILCPAIEPSKAPVRPSDESEAPPPNVIKEHSVRGGVHFVEGLFDDLSSSVPPNANAPRSRRGLAGLPTIVSRPGTADSPQLDRPPASASEPSYDAVLKLSADDDSVHSSKASRVSSSDQKSPTSRRISLTRKLGIGLSPSRKNLGDGLSTSPASRGRMVKRQSLASMFDRTVQTEGNQPIIRRRSLMPVRNRKLPPTKSVDLPWQGNPHSRAHADGSGSTGISGGSPEGARVRPAFEHTASSGASIEPPSPGINWNLASGEVPADTRVVQFSQFTQLRYLGEGEFATVHAEVLDGNPVALKILKQSKRNDPRAVKGLKREIMLMSLMEHPNVLRALALGQEHGKPFMVVEKLGNMLAAELPGQMDVTPIWSRWPQCKQWPLSRALDCAVQLAAALRFCHDEAFAGYRVLHRDVKPANIGFKPDGQLVLFDFGLATLWARDKDDPDDNIPRKLTGETGSLRYMAPEVANSEPYNHRAEVFSFATVVWEMACHRRPFEGFSPDIFAASLSKGVLPVRSRSRTFPCPHASTRASAHRLMSVAPLHRRATC